MAMNNIFKYRLREVTSQIVEMPSTHRIIRLAYQRNVLYFWAEVDTESEVNEEYFLLFGTGAGLQTSRKMEHVGSVETPGGTFIWHIYKVINDAW